LSLYRLSMNMQNRTKRLTFSAILSASSIVLLLLSQVMPTTRYGLAILAGLPVFVVAHSCGHRYGLMSFLTTAILSNLFLPLKATIIAYTFLFGCYPLFQVVIETNHKIGLRLKRILKVVYSQISLMILSGFTFFLLPEIKTYLVWYWILIGWAGYSILFRIYDKIIILFGQYYYKRFQNNHQYKN